MSYAELLTAYKDARTARREAADALDAEFQAAQFAAYAERFPKRKRPDSLGTLAQRCPEIPTEVRSRFEDRAREVWETGSAAIKAAEEALNEAAQDLALTPGEEWTKFREVWESTYSTQGFGASHYAKGAAESAADVARHYGIPVEIRPVVKGERHKRTDWEVWVQLSEDQTDALGRKPGPTMREWVMLCWRRGVNPRVFNPFLPHGYEEREGISFQGRDLRA